MTNLTSSLNTILARIISFDPFGNNKYEIDTQKEYNLLGSYLNGSHNFENLKPAEQLEKKDFEYLAKLYNNLKYLLNKNYAKDNSNSVEALVADLYSISENSSDEEIESLLKKINKDNILNIGYSSLWGLFKKTPSDKFNKNNYEYLKNIYLEMIYELIDNPLLLKRQENLKNSNLSENYNWEIDRTLYKLTNIDTDIETISTSFCNNHKDAFLNLAILEDILKNIQKAISTQLEIDKIEELNSNPNDTRSELQKYSENEFLKNRGVTNISNSGADGDISIAGARQYMNGNCWLLGGINSLAATDLGKKLLKDNIYIDDVHGFVVVKLKEAEMKGYGKDGKGIYFIPSDKLKHSVNGIGDPDILAYNYAVNEYFKECNENEDKINEDKIKYGSERLDGNSGYRFYEILTGEENKKLDNLNSIPKGIISIINYNKTENVDDIYNSLINFAENKKPIQLAITLVEGSRIEYGDGRIEQNYRLASIPLLLIYAEGDLINHAFSVVGTKDGALICQESNNSEIYAKAFPVHWRDENGTWNFLVEKEHFEKSPITASILNL